MADQLLATIRTVVEGQIDFQGQKKTELITTIVLIGTGLTAFLIGYIQQNIHLVVWIGLLGTFVTFVMVVPAWPIYNEDPEKWLPDATAIAGQGIVVDGKKIN